MAKTKAKKLIHPTVTEAKVSENGIEVPILAEAIVEIGKAAKRLSASGMNRKGVVVLLKHHSGVSMREINLVLDGLNDLAELYCK